MKLYPENATVPSGQQDKSNEGRDFEYAKTLIRNFVGPEDEALEDWQLVNLICGCISHKTVNNVRKLAPSKADVPNVINSMGIPRVHQAMNGAQKQDAIHRAKNNLDVVGPDECKSLNKREALQCVREVIEERKASWVYETE